MTSEEKQELKKLNFNGFTWWGLVEGVHGFHRAEGGGLHSNIYVTPEQITNGDLEYFAKNGFTLSDEKVREIQRKFRKNEKSRNSVNG